MIRHIFKIIWTERKTNTWLLLELILVFCILWFCADYLYFMVNRYLEPKGFDIEHTYRIEFGTKDDWEGDWEERINYKWAIYDRVKAYPTVEQASYSVFAQPYGAYTGNKYLVDSVEQMVTDKMVTPEFFDVFHIKMITGRIFNWDDAVSGNYAIISAGADNLFAHKPPTEIKYIDLGKNKHKVIGVAERSKKNDYDDYAHIAYVPLKKDDDFMPSWSDLSIRVKPEADYNFIEKFKEDMQAQLEVGPYYLTSVVSIEKDRQRAIDRAGYDNNFKSIYSIAGFLIINIFLAVIGSFWFRMQARRSEIGLRLALGASKRNVKLMFTTETVIILFIASIIATILCVNISMIDILKDIGIPIINREEGEVIVNQHFINYILTLLTLLIVTIFAVWYPAYRASRIQPSEALKEE